MLLHPVRDERRLDQVGRVDDGELRVGRRRDEAHNRDDQQESAEHRVLPAQNGFGAPGATYAGSSISLVRYTFTRCPSRMVMVGSLFRNRFITWIVSLRRRIADTARDDDGSVAIAAIQSSTSQVLGQAADQSDRRRGSERGQVVMVHLVAEAGVADLIESEELVEAVRAAVRHQQAVEGHGEPRFAERLDGLRFAENPRAGGNQHLPSRMRVERIGHETVHRRGARAIQSIRQHGVDDGSFQHCDAEVPPR